ncbi:MAG: hypothetical protein HY062_16140 [Bacteroidetes bacterium]|nr:hypothetical protein [Bacteroidota bacterium]
METITNTSQLRVAIDALEKKQLVEGALLKEQCKITYESLKPLNLIKTTFKELVTPDLKGNILDGALSIAAGYISKKAAIGSTHNPLKQLLGTVLQLGVTSLVSKNTNGIKSGVLNIISSVFKKRNEPYNRTNINITPNK